MKSSVYCMIEGVGGVFSFAAPLPNLSIGARCEASVKVKDYALASNLSDTEEVSWR